MKKIILILTLSLFSIMGFSQLKNEVYLNYGFGNSDVILSETVIGDFGYKTSHFNIYSANYLRSLNKHLSFETGLSFSEDKIICSSFPTGVEQIRTDMARIISAAFGLRVTFLKYCFVNAGLLQDIETGRNAEKITADQSGTGLYTGIGFRFPLKKVTFTVNPFMQEHCVIPYNQSGNSYKERLFENGIKIGLGYKF